MKSWVLLMGLAVMASAQTPAPQGFAREGNPVKLDCADGKAEPLELRGGEAWLSVSCGADADAPLQARYKLGIAESTVELKDADPEWRPQEVLWSPTGKAFVVNGTASAIGGKNFQVYRLEGGDLKRVDIAGAARKAMFERLAKCWPQMRKGREFSDQGLRSLNMLALSWLDEGRALAVFGEVPPSSMFGAAMGDVMGFEIDARTGSVLRSLTAADFKQRWQPAASWALAVPPPARCGKLFTSD